MPRLLKQIISYVISFAVYAFFFNWKAGLLLIAMVGLHEAGHIYTAKYVGIKTRGTFMVPFVGGVSLLSSRSKFYFDDAVIALAGPFAGCMISLVLIALFGITHQAFWVVSCVLNAGFNLFNLLPLALLDGGRIASDVVNSINRKYNYHYTVASYGILFLLMLKFNLFFAPVILMIGVMASMQARQQHRLLKYGLVFSDEPEKMTASNLKTIVFLYLGLILVLVMQVMFALCMYHTGEMKAFFTR